MYGDNTFNQIGKGKKWISKPQVVFDGGIKQVSCSVSEKHCHTGALGVDGQVYFWGDPYKGQLGIYLGPEGWTHKNQTNFCEPQKVDMKCLDEGDQVTKVVAGGIHSAFLTE